MVGRRELKVEKKKLEILRSAASVFKQKGYHGATMEDIGDKLLMTKGSLYYYFKNKEEILYTCQIYSLKMLMEVLEKANKSNLSPSEKLRTLIVHHVKLITDELNASVMHVEFDMLSPPILKKVIAKRDEYEQAFRRLIQEGIRSGDFMECDPKITSFAILGAINWTTKWFSSDGRTSSENIARTFADYFIRGLNPEVLTQAETVSQPSRPSEPTNREQFLSYD